MCARYDPEWIAGLLDPERRLGSMTAEELLLDSGLEAGMTVVDYGCGPGHFTEPAARIVGPQGTVYALDIEPRMVSLVAGRAEEAGLQNVKALLNEGDGAPLPDTVADLVICMLVLHYAEDDGGRQRVARDIGRLVKSGGHVVVIQWSDRVPYEETVELLEPVGFRCDGPHPTAEGQDRVKAVRR